MTLTLPAFLDALDEVPSLELAHSVPLTHMELAALIRVARDTASEHPTPALGWSEWLEWAGGPDAKCPLPGDREVRLEGYPYSMRAELWTWEKPCRFSYRCLPGGWIERGDFVPPESVYPLGVRFASGEESEIESINETNSKPSYWNSDSLIGGRITHIRLVAREKACEACEMPEGWYIASNGDLMSPDGVIVLLKVTHKFYGPDTILQAVRAYLASMKERGNG